MRYIIRSTNKHGVIRVWDAEHPNDDAAVHDSWTRYSYTEEVSVWEIDDKWNVIRVIE